MPDELMMKTYDNEDDNHDNEIDSWSNWTYSEGYLNPPSFDLDHQTLPKEMPIRGIAPGTHMGMSILINIMEEEYLCSGTESTGVKVNFVNM